MKKLSAIILIVSIGLLFMGCPGPYPKDPTYLMHLSYSNSKGEDLLKSSVVGHFNPSAIKLNEISFGDEFRIDTLSTTASDLSVYLHGRVDLITLSSSDIDTLISTFSGNRLIGLSYNKKDILPSNLNYGNYAFNNIAVSIVK